MVTGQETVSSSPVKYKRPSPGPFRNGGFLQLSKELMVLWPSLQWFVSVVSGTGFTR